MVDKFELPVENPEARLRSSRAVGDLVTRLEVRRQSEAVNDAVAPLEAMDGVSVDVIADSTTLEVLGGKATFLKSATIHGAQHKSLKGRIEAFTQDRAMAGSGKFGVGTYFGLGELTGESVDLLATRQGHTHEARVAGNFLLLNRTNFREINGDLQKLTGSESLIRSSLKNDSRFSGMVSQIGVNGDPIDGIVIFMDESSAGAELIVLPASTDHIAIENVTVT